MAIRSTISSMQIGDRIICEYDSPSSGKTGSFFNLGTSTAMQISTTLSDVANGSFYFIYLGNDEKGNRLLIADRSLQHSMTYDQLNAVGYACYEGIKLEYDLTSSLIAAYHFNNSWNTSLAGINGIGSAFTGTINGTTSVAGYNGKARSFNGTSDYILFTDSILPIGTKSIRFKMKRSAAPASGTTERILNTGIPASDASVLDIFISSSGYLSYLIRQVGTVIVSASSSYNVCDNVWHDVLFIQNDVLRKVYCYVDGVLRSTTDYASNMYDDTTYTKSLCIGAAYTATAGTYQFFYAGILDELEIHSKAISPTYSVFNTSLTTNYYLKLPTGGVSAGDRENEFDQLIVNNDGNGIIEAGKSTLWNSSYTTSTRSVSATAANRVNRGGANIYTRSEAVTTSSSTSLGFRPMLVIETNNSFSSSNVKNALTDLNIGDAIVCQYDAQANTAGIFSNLGTASGRFISQSGTSADAPSGSAGNLFYFIKTAKGVLVADRVIQTSISWDALNAAKYIFGSSGITSNIGIFSSVIYVSSTGNDNNKGTSSNPVKTINQAMTLSNTGGVIVFSAGTFPINTTNKYLTDLATTKKLTFIGQGQSTVIEVGATQGNIAMTGAIGASFYNLVIRPAATFNSSAYTNALWASSSGSTFIARFVNVLFTTLNNYPTECYFQWQSTGILSAMDAQFINCSFTGSIPMEKGGNAAIRHINCAYGASSASKNNVSYIPLHSLANATFDSNYQLTNAQSLWKNVGYQTNIDGTKANIGVYGGSKQWGAFSFAIDKNILIRSMTGGITAANPFNQLSTNATAQSFGKNQFPSTNEWDTWIANGTLNNTIAAADNTVWNWANGDHSNACWVQDSTYTSRNNRSIRPFGYARTINGTTDRIVYSAKVLSPGSKTISFRYKRNGAPASTYEHILSTGIAGTDGSQFRVYNRAATGILAGSLTFAVQKVGTTVLVISTLKNVSDNMWHDIVFIQDDTNRKVSIYVDGVLDRETVYQAGQNDDTTYSRNLIVGATYATASTYTGNLTASIDELSIIDASGAYALYAPMNEAAGNLGDSSPNLYSGNITGTTVINKSNVKQGLITEITTTTSINAGTIGFRPVLEYNE